ncbi:MAG: diaminopimelate decarboxylase [Planctomycetota bacterium]
MRHFEYRENDLYVEDVSVGSIVERYGTPCFVYSLSEIRDSFRELERAMSAVETLVCYSIKANSNLAILDALRKEGAGFDVVSGGELRRALRVGAEAKKIVYAGVGKTAEEMNLALEAGILMFNVESAEELQVLDEFASELGRQAPVALRINPDVDAHTHHHITTGKKENKFGIDAERALEILQQARNLRGIRIVGMHMHIGSQITSTGPYRDAVRALATLIQESRSLGHEIMYLNAGGGFGIRYETEEVPSPEDFASAIIPTVREIGCKLILEPGRFIVGNAGILVTRTQFVKRTATKRFIITDAAMNDLVRPALYDAYHTIWPVTSPVDIHLLWAEHGIAALANLAPADVVGPVCETGDFFARGRMLPELERGDLLAIFSAGAYGMSMSSNYNSRPRAAEVLVSKGKARLVRRRETFDDLIAQEVHLD